MTTQSVPCADDSAAYDVSTVDVRTDDGLNLTLTRYLREPTEDVVLVVHGLTTSRDMFLMPEHRNLVDYLLDSGFTDVWLLDGRMSNRHAYNSGPHAHTLDDVARYDYPAALDAIATATGDAGVHVVSHCLGATSVLMSAAAGAADGVRSIIANSVGLTPRVPRWSRLKLTVAPGLLERLLRLPAIAPTWSDEPLLSRRGLLAAVTSAVHPECDEPACHLLSMMWGSGQPALYQHENLHDATHARVGELFGPTAFSYYRHIAAMLHAGRAVSDDRAADRALADDYLAAAAGAMPPVLLTTGADNKVFAESNIVCYRRMSAVAPGRHELEVFPGYGHQDVFMGRHNDRDVFPRMVRFLRRHAWADR